MPGIRKPQLTLVLNHIRLPGMELGLFRGGDRLCHSRGELSAGKWLSE